MIYVSIFPSSDESCFLFADLSEPWAAEANVAFAATLKVRGIWKKNISVPRREICFAFPQDILQYFSEKPLPWEIFFRAKQGTTIPLMRTHEFRLRGCISRCYDHSNLSNRCGESKPMFGMRFWRSCQCPLQGIFSQRTLRFDCGTASDLWWRKFLQMRAVVR